MIEVLKKFPDNIVAFACHGQVTQHDYETVLVPVVERALKQHHRLRLYYETAVDFVGIDPGAVWEDTKIGIAHMRHWERIAVVTDVEWIRLAIQAFRLLMPGALKVFSTSEATKARTWILAD